MLEVRMARRTLFWNLPDRSHRLDSPLVGATLSKAPPCWLRWYSMRCCSACLLAAFDLAGPTDTMEWNEMNSG